MFLLELFFLLLTLCFPQARTATLQKSFHVLRLEPFSIESKWFLVKEYCSRSNKSIDRWTRDDTLDLSDEPILGMSSRRCSLIDACESEEEEGNQLRPPHLDEPEQIDTQLEPETKLLKEPVLSTSSSDESESDEDLQLEDATYFHMLAPRKDSLGPTTDTDQTDPDTDVCDSHSERGSSPVTTPRRSTDAVLIPDHDDIWRLDMSLIPDFAELKNLAKIEQRPLPLRRGSRRGSQSPSLFGSLLHI